MKNWIITIIGVILLNLIVEIILSESNLSSFIKKIFSIISVLLIISPITKLLNFNNINFYNIVFDNSYLDYSFGNYDVYIENYLKSILESNGFENITEKYDAIIGLDFFEKARKNNKKEKRKENGNLVFNKK